ncbi:MAG: class II fructose-bisphosphate aldolase [Rectinemataceae bacterium]
MSDTSAIVAKARRLDHVPAIDEDGLRVDFLPIIKRALAAGFESVMVDGSRLPFEENIAAARSVVELCAPSGVEAEARLDLERLSKIAAAVGMGGSALRLAA